MELFIGIPTRRHATRQDGAGIATRLLSLTPREREVLGLLVAGESTPSIGVELGIAETTVDNHIQHVLDKLAVHSRAEAVSAVFRAMVASPFAVHRLLPLASRPAAGTTGASRGHATRRRRRVAGVDRSPRGHRAGRRRLVLLLRENPIANPPRG